LSFAILRDWFQTPLQSPGSEIHQWSSSLYTTL
jgi:hypothetical protein